MQGMARKAPLPGGSLHCCTLMTLLALHSQQMACRVTSLIHASSMHVGIGIGQMCPNVPLLEYGAEVLVPTREHARALESALIQP